MMLTVQVTASRRVGWGKAPAARVEALVASGRGAAVRRAGVWGLRRCPEPDRTLWALLREAVAFCRAEILAGRTWFGAPLHRACVTPDELRAVAGPETAGSPPPRVASG